VKWATIALSLALLGGTGCSLDGSSEPKPAKGASRDVGAVVQRLERAAGRADWRTVCDRIFTAGARKRAGGNDCPRLLRSDAEGIVRPSIEVLHITLKRRGGAAVRVRSRARGQPPLEDVIELKREGGGYRVDSLAG
jgi:hypothetical protein